MPTLCMEFGILLGSPTAALGVHAFAQTAECCGVLALAVLAMAFDESTVRCNCGQLLGPMAPGTGMHLGSLAPPMKFESNSDCGAALTYVSVCIGISSQCACTVALWLALLVAMLNAASGRHGSDDDCSA